MIVIDVGCARYGGDYSIERLIEEFKPAILYGFDPSSQTGDLFGDIFDSGTEVVIEKKAAWIYDGEIGFLEDGLNSCLTNRTDVPMVPCFDLAGFICDVDSRHVHPSESPAIVLKIDAEGSEYDLLEHIIETGHDRWLKLAWVEWHPKRIANGAQRRRTIEERISCEMREWFW